MGNEKGFVELCPVCTTAIKPHHLTILIAYRDWEDGGKLKHTDEWHILLARELRKRKKEQDDRE